ncbi:MAG: hypothetical protein ACRD7E_31400, partial [Bryobacteraceae bacterium]
GKLFRMSDESGDQGEYESPVHDAGGVARWGQVSWRGATNANTRLLFRTRSGNSARPDKTWSEWSEPLSEPRGQVITSPNARFLQWKAEFSSTDGTSPALSGVTVSYLPQNTAPIVRSISVSTHTAGAAPAKAAPQPVSTAAYSITVTDTGEAGPSTLSGTPTQNASNGVSQQIQITWQADDPDGDRLVYAIYFRGENEQQWKLLRTNFTESSLVLEGEVFADGKYLFRVVASDKMSNPAASAREADLTSSQILFDNTPPIVTPGAPSRNGASLELGIAARDTSSPLRRAEYSLNATAWVPLEPADGIIDGLEEQFKLRLENLPAGEHLVVIRAYDSSNNAGLTKVVVQ